MNSTVLPGEGRSAPRWTPPLDSRELYALLAKVQRWEPFDGDALLEVVGEVLYDGAPPADSIDDLAEKLRGHLAQLMRIGAGARVEEEDEQVCQLMGWASGLRGVLPGEYWQAVGHLRRTAWAVNELAERLAALNCLKAVAV
ncbi:DUF6415 family natural product biosynthesis protein [Streptomyces sp. NPDC087903]|uniref:DUF6415 family natural product biosynthesis protein n=1 Tax=Streptomyces sp. NPDC087903 TaxID=3365819 RepID=UPI00382E5231